MMRFFLYQWLIEKYFREDYFLSDTNNLFRVFYSFHSDRYAVVLKVLNPNLSKFPSLEVHLKYMYAAKCYVFFRQIKGEKFLNIQQSRSFDVKIPCNQAWQSDQRIRRKLGDQILKSFLKITANMIAKGLIKLENQTT